MQNLFTVVLKTRETELFPFDDADREISQIKAVQKGAKVAAPNQTCHLLSRRLECQKRDLKVRRELNMKVTTVNTRAAGPGGLFNTSSTRAEDSQWIIF